ncbi:MAG: YfhO family protein, partial [Candidatus Geothermincolales bacterium]
VDSANLNVMERIRGGGQDVHLRMEDSSSRWDVSATSPEPFVLAISQNFMKGWKAYIDGNEVSPFSVNGVLTGVAVPEGGHRVILEYEPPGLKAGTLISLVALLFLSSLTCLVYIYSRRNGKRDGERP